MILLNFLSTAVLTFTLASCEQLGVSGLHFDENTAYASGYNNYQPRDYHFDYAVSDPHTGDHKSQWEVKEKGVVRGGYSLLEPDGTTRVVEYIADHDGFRAVVKKLGTAIHPEHVGTAIISEPILQQPHYQSYDGQVENYANLINTQKIEIPQNNYQIQPQPIIYQHAPLIPTYLGNHQPLAQSHQGQPFDSSESVEYHGLTGNVDDDSAYTNYDGDSRSHAEYSHNVERVVQAPLTKPLENFQQFVIFYPGLEHK